MSATGGGSAGAAIPHPRLGRHGVAAAGVSLFDDASLLLLPLLPPVLPLAPPLMNPPMPPELLQPAAASPDARQITPETIRACGRMSKPLYQTRERARHINPPQRSVIPPAQRHPAQQHPAHPAQRSVIR